MKFSKQSRLMIALAALIVIVDQASKRLVSTHLQLYQTWVPVPALSHYFTITYTTNTGVAFGLFKEWGTIFIGVAVLVIAAIILYQQQVPDGQWLVHAALGFQLGGAIGNLVDRLRMGHVIDFLDVKFWPVFNIADSSIVLGVALLMLFMAREPTSPVQIAPALPKQTE